MQNQLFEAALGITHAATSFARTREEMEHSGFECPYARKRCEL
jgi:hypothetical protein